MKETLKDLFGFMYSLSMGDYFFFIGTFLLIVLFIYIIYLLKTEPEELPKKKEEKFDISKVTKNLEENFASSLMSLDCAHCKNPKCPPYLKNWIISGKHTFMQGGILSDSSV